MERFSLFDFLAFILPGAMALFIIGFLLQRTGLNIDTLATENNRWLLLIPATCVAYIMGHILNHFRVKWQWVQSKQQRSFIEALESRRLAGFCPQFAQYARSYFGISIFQVDESQNQLSTLSEKDVDLFFDLSFQLLDQQEKFSKPIDMRSQAIFFDNMKLLCISAFTSVLCMLFFDLSKYFCKPDERIWNTTMLTIDGTVMAICLILIFALQALAKKKWKWFYNMAWEYFYVYFTQAEQLKK
jgi:hypothetical protein